MSKTLEMISPSPDEGFTRAIVPGNCSHSWGTAGWEHLPLAAPLHSSPAVRRAMGSKEERGGGVPSAGCLLL